MNIIPDGDIEQAEVFLRGVEYLTDGETVIKIWDFMSHRFPNFEYINGSLIEKEEQNGRNIK